VNFFVAFSLQDFRFMTQVEQMGFMVEKGAHGLKIMGYFKFEENKNVCRSIIIIIIIIIIIEGIILSLRWRKFVVYILFIYQDVFRQLLKFTAYNIFKKISTIYCPARGTEVSMEKMFIYGVCKIFPLTF
jgi:hypothetical protein